MAGRDSARRLRVQRVRTGVRWFTAALATATVVLYALIAAGILQPVDTELHPQIQQVSLAVPAAVAHLILVIALLRVDWRATWIIAAGTHVTAVWLYVQLAELREPAFEVSGLSIAALQVTQAILLAGLAAHRPASPEPAVEVVRPPGPPRVLVATGSTGGTTADIGCWIAGHLQEAGLVAEARDAATVRDVSGHDAVIVGGAIRMGRWHPAARRLVRRHRRALATRPVWMFSSGPLDASASEHGLDPIPTVARLMETVSARGHATFGGSLQTGAGGPLTRAIARDRSGDWRDPDQIRAWSLEVAAALGASTSTSGQAARDTSTS